MTAPDTGRHRRRSPDDRLLTLREAGDRVGYSSEYLRKRMWTDHPPPLVKLGGRWKVWLDDLDVWVAESVLRGELAEAQRREGLEERGDGEGSPS